MSIEIDPRIVREVAEAALRSTDGGSPAERVEAALIASGVAGPVLSKKFDAYSEVVGAEYDRLVTRKVARTAMEMAATRRDDLDLAIRRHGGLGDMPEEPKAKAEYRKAYGALYGAAAADMKAGATVVVSWPDEQLDERDAALARVRAFCNRWVEIQPAGYDVIDGFPGVDIKLTISDLLAALGNDDTDA